MQMNVLPWLPFLKLPRSPRSTNILISVMFQKVPIPKVNSDVGTGCQGDQQSSSPPSSLMESYKCQECGKVYMSYTGFKDHIRRHQGQFRHRCPVCGEGFMNLNQFQGHVNRHGNLRPFSCPICEKTFSQPNNAKQHLRMVHKVNPKLFAGKLGLLGFQ